MRTQLALLLLSLAQGTLSSSAGQTVLGSASDHTGNGMFTQDAIAAALKKHDDPVEAMLFLDPSLAAQVNEPRLLHVHGDKEAKWLTEGDKMRLRRQGRKFIDITGYDEYYNDVESLFAGDPRKSYAHRMIAMRSWVRVLMNSGRPAQIHPPAPHQASAQPYLGGPHGKGHKALLGLLQQILRRRHWRPECLLATRRDCQGALPMRPVLAVTTIF